MNLPSLITHETALFHAFSNAETYGITEQNIDQETNPKNKHTTIKQTIISSGCFLCFKSCWN